MKAIISDSDNVVTNTWDLLVRTVFKLKKEYETDIWGMKSKYGTTDAAAPGPIEFSKEGLREKYYKAFLEEMGIRVKNRKKIISKKNLIALKKIKEYKIPLIIYTGNHQTVAESYFKKYSDPYTDIGIKSVHGYREEDFRMDMENEFKDPMNKKRILERLFREENLRPEDTILIEDGPRAIKMAGEMGVTERHGIYTIGFPGTDILVPLPKFFSYMSNGVESNWSFASAVKEIING